MTGGTSPISRVCSQHLSKWQRRTPAGPVESVGDKGAAVSQKQPPWRWQENIRKTVVSQKPGEQIWRERTIHARCSWWVKGHKIWPQYQPQAGHWGLDKGNAQTWKISTETARDMAPSTKAPIIPLGTVMCPLLHRDGSSSVLWPGSQKDLIC